MVEQQNQGGTNKRLDTKKGSKTKNEAEVKRQKKSKGAQKDNFWRQEERSKDK